MSEDASQCCLDKRKGIVLVIEKGERLKCLQERKIQRQIKVIPFSFYNKGNNNELKKKMEVNNCRNTKTILLLLS